MPNPQRLAILTDLRKAASLSLSDMARACGLAGNQSHQTAGAWELGRMTPTVRRRAGFIPYLWDKLALRKQPDQFEQVWAVLVEEWDWAPLSDAEWQRLTQQPRPSLLAPAKHSPLAPFQAPALTPHFVGREQALADLGQRLVQRQPPAIYALVGMGGVGKTTLALHLAHALRKQFADGVLWARVATTQPLDIAQAWAQAYGYDYSALPDGESRAVALRGLLAEKQVLLVLDDVADPALVRPLLPGSDLAVVLLTTRDHDVAAALHAQCIPVGELAPQASLALLRLVLTPARVTAELGAAEEICAALQHLPLAVEIAAQRLKARERQKLGALAAQLHDITARLNLAIADQAVRASFLASWEILGPALRHVFACCGCFGGRAFTTPALAYVADLELAVAEDALLSLVALSLLNAEEAERYRQHALLAAFAREQLGDAPATEGRLAAYYLAFSRQYQTSYAQLEPEWENIMAALETAQRRQQWPLVLAYVETLTPPWFTQARYSQARQGYAWGCAAATALAQPNALANCLQKWGQAALEQDDYADAAVQWAKAYALYQQVADTAGLATLHYWLARLAIEQIRYLDADEHLQAGQALALANQDEASLALIFYQQASLAYNRGQWEQAQRCCEQALHLQTKLEERRELPPTLRLLADIAIEKGQIAAAQQYCEQALAVANQLQNRAEIAASLYGLAITARKQAQWPQALAWIRQAQTLFAQMGDQGLHALALYEQSMLHMQAQEHEAAQQAGLESLKRLRLLQDQFSLVYVLNHLGKLAYQADQHATARQYWQEGLQLAEREAHPKLGELRARYQHGLAPHSP